jgi:hypothetical protein
MGSLTAMVAAAAMGMATTADDDDGMNGPPAGGELTRAAATNVARCGARGDKCSGRQFGEQSGWCVAGKRARWQQGVFEALRSFRKVARKERVWQRAHLDRIGREQGSISCASATFHGCRVSLNM